VDTRGEQQARRASVVTGLEDIVVQENTTSLSSIAD
jgi:hypothetical protein